MEMICTLFALYYQHVSGSNVLPIGHVHHLPSLGATQSIVLVPPEKYIVFQNNVPAIFYCYGSGFENGAVVGWILNGTGYGLKHAQMGITYVTTPSGANISSHLIIPSNSSIYNGTEVKCKTIDSISNTVQMSEPANLTIQGECCSTP